VSVVPREIRALYSAETITVFQAFGWALARSALSGYDSRVHTSRDQWKREMRRSPVRIQWDPERDLNLEPLSRRSLQVGLRGEAVHHYLDEWIVGIDDVTDLAHAVHELTREGLGEQAAALLPVDRLYPLPGPLASRIGASDAEPRLGGDAGSDRRVMGGCGGERS
jgi:hypothetical protein